MIKISIIGQSAFGESVAKEILKMKETIISSVFSHPTHLSVIETPYWSFDKSSSKVWPPGLMLLSSIIPIILLLPFTFWLITSSNTTGCLLWSLFELPWEQSTTIFGSNPFFSSNAWAVLTDSSS